MAGVIIYNKSTNRYTYSVNADLSKLISGGIDVSLTSALPEHVAKGQWFYTADGELCEGTVETMGFQDMAVMPTTTRQVFQTTGKILTSDVVVEGDVNLNANNIKKGVSIFGVEGAFGPYDGTTLVQSVVPRGYYYYDATGELVEGSAPVSDGITIMPGEMDQRIASGQYIASDIIIEGEPNLSTHNWLDTITIFGRQGSIPTYDGPREFTPSTQEQVIHGGVYISGDLKIGGDVNLSANNISEGVSIFGVVGTLHVPDYGMYACEAHEVLKGSTFINKQGEVGEGGIEYYTGPHEVQPGITQQVLNTAQRYIEQDIVVLGDEYLQPENIIEGTTIFGVEGTAPYVPEVDQVTVDDTKVVEGESFIGRDKLLHVGSMPAFDSIDMPYSLKPWCDSYAYPDYRDNTSYMACTGHYFYNDVQIEYCENFLPENIKEGVDMWGVIGTYAGSTVDFNEASVTANYVANICSFYDSNGELVMGEAPMHPGGYIDSLQDVTIDCWNDTILVSAGTFVENDLVLPPIPIMDCPYAFLPEYTILGVSGTMKTFQTDQEGDSKHRINVSECAYGEVVVLEYDTFTYSDIVIDHEPNLVPENIAKDVTIFGIVGTHEGAWEAAKDGLSTIPETFVPEGYSYMDADGYQKWGNARIAQDGPVYPTGQFQVIIGESTFVEVNGNDKYGIWIEEEPNFIPENIRKGVYIWGIEGTYDGGDGSSSGSGDGESSGSGSFGEIVFIASGELNYIRESMAYGSNETIWFGANGMVNPCPADAIAAAGVDCNDNAAFCAFLAETLNSFTSSQYGYSDDTAYNWEYSAERDTLVCRTMNSGVKHAPILFSVGESGNSVTTCFFDIEFN